jgi:pyruvate/2-oxoglutarate dehydrogenase complex dihydrolipoamide acyltransferase (E2) component
MEAMKMEHVIKADVSGIVKKINVEPGDIIVEGHPLIFVEEGELDEASFEEEEAIDLDYIRPDLEEAYATHSPSMRIDPKL